jgi:hypothetical protein
MKLGILISLIIVVVLGAIGYFVMRGVPEVLSKETNERVLKRATLADNVPPLYEVTSPNGDAGDKYRRAVRLYTMNAARFERDNPPQDLVADLVSLVVDAGREGGVQPGLLDDQIPIKTGALPDFGDALEGVHVVLATEAQRRFEAGDRAGALGIARGTLAMGQRLFTHSVRLYNRRIGLEMMESAIGWMRSMADQIEGGEEKIKQWEHALLGIREGWDVKIPIVRSVKPHIGDLLNIARQDQDPTFRLEAMLHLGIAKFNPGHRGNLRAIQETIAAGKADANPQIAAAAASADAFTIEEMRKLR